jgi:hypothetical protein
MRQSNSQLVRRKSPKQAAGSAVEHLYHKQCGAPGGAAA